MEEYCRFALNSSALSERAKQLRHELSTAVGKLDVGRLVASRDTLGDVGVDQEVEGQFKRSGLVDCLTAACKRLGEALRVLAETTQTIDASIAKSLEKLRYTAYTLEKDIVLFGSAAEKFKRVKLYVIISSNLPTDVVILAQQCVSGGADCLQLRAKDVDDDRHLASAAKFVNICGSGGALSIINDRADIAVAAGADGVHLGQNDLPVEYVRKLQMSPLIIGKSTHSVEQLRAACEEQPTYVSLGPVFSTRTKPTAEPVGLGYVREGIRLLSETGIGHVAIGGITPANIGQVLKAGASVIAVCAAVTEAKDPATACKALKERILEGQPS
jgi:thiamine-phosphate pyrophosphorylase